MAVSPDRIEHIVVLMMENRSFDQMLGHLSLDGRKDVDGLRPEMANTHAGTNHKVFASKATALTKAQDPPHGSVAIDDSLKGDNGGFVRAYATAHPQDKQPGVVMSYHTAAQLPVYRHLAEEFCVCDRWFASVPGSTWPNRLYAVAGRAAGSRDNVSPPIYNVPTLFRLLDKAHVSWRWYAHDPGTLRFIDGSYRIGHGGNFSFFNRRTLLSRRHFLDDAREGKLPAVAWIDPNFVDFQVPFDRALSNDDHPPSDVMRGQQLVLEVYNAVARGPKWDKTLLVITYDEHGGFFDHVPPPAAPDDDGRFRRYGVRVPALVVSPYVERRVVAPRQPVFDHTSIIKTILRRFCRQANGAVPKLTRRVDEAHDLWHLLTRDVPRMAPLPAIDKLLDDAAERQRNAFVRLRTTEFAPEPEVTLELSDLQREIVAGIEELRRQGLPANQP
jgi:phospholipase C